MCLYIYFFFPINVKCYLLVFRYMKFQTDPNGRYLCPNCGSSYKQKGHLVRHIKYECGVEPQFKCHLCFRKFKHKSNLKAHYLIMHKEGERALNVRDYRRMSSGHFLLEKYKLPNASF